MHALNIKYKINFIILVGAVWGPTAGILLPLCSVRSQEEELGWVGWVPDPGLATQNHSSSLTTLSPIKSTPGNFLLNYGPSVSTLQHRSSALCKLENPQG